VLVVATTLAVVADELVPVTNDDVEIDVPVAFVNCVDVTFDDVATLVVTRLVGKLEPVELTAGDIVVFALLLPLVLLLPAPGTAVVVTLFGEPVVATAKVVVVAAHSALPPPPLVRLVLLLEILASPLLLLVVVLFSSPTDDDALPLHGGSDGTVEELFTPDRTRVTFHVRLIVNVT
jgi:hypothetical protein